MIEASLLHKIKKGDDKAFEEVFRAYFKPLTIFSVQIVKDIEVAEEIVQEFFVKWLEDTNSINIKSSLKNYLYRSVYNSSLNYLKHNKVKSVARDYFMVNADVKHEEVFEKIKQIELEHNIHLAINKLPVKCKNVFEMSRVDGKKNSEIADALEISIRTVETHISNALKIMRVELKDYLSILIFILLNLFI